MIIMFEMQILVGRVTRFDGALHATVVIEEGEWQPVIPPPIPGANLAPYRYENKEDARIMLDRMFPSVPADCKRTVRAVEKVK